MEEQVCIQSGFIGTGIRTTALRKWRTEICPTVQNCYISPKKSRHYLVLPHFIVTEYFPGMHFSDVKKFILKKKKISN